MEKIIIENEPIEVTEIRNKILSEFGDLRFDEGPHKYFLGDKELPSVSHVTHQFAPTFDDEEIATNYALKHGMTKEYWLDKWKFKNLTATITGTQVHSWGESIAWLLNGHPELITPDHRYEYVEEKNWLIPTRKKEEAILNFWTDVFADQNTWFVLAETKVYTGKNKELTDLKQDYAGTFDLLWYYKHPTDDEKSGLIILDYKTNQKLEDSYAKSKGKFLFAPFSDLYSQALSLYNLQLSAYQIPLEDIGLKVIGRRIIWLKEDSTYELIPTNDYTKQLRAVL